MLVLLSRYSNLYLLAYDNVAQEWTGKCKICCCKNKAFFGTFLGVLTYSYLFYGT